MPKTVFNLCPPLPTSNWNFSNLQFSNFVAEIFVEN